MTRQTNVDYSLYYVTGRSLLPDPADYVAHLERALQGGTTIVQIREKDVDSREFLEVAIKSKQVCDKVRCRTGTCSESDLSLASLLPLAPE